MQFRRGNSNQNSTFTGAAGELTVDTSGGTLRVHDGIVAGGNILLNNTLAKVLLTRLDGNIVPLTDNTYALGTPALRFKELYVAGNSIFLGGITIKDGGNSIQVVNSTGVTLLQSNSSLSVSNVLAGTGIVVTGQGGSGATPTIALATSGVTPLQYGGSSKVPVITVDTYGRITSASNVNVAGVSGFSASGNTFTIATADGSNYTANLPSDQTFLNMTVSGNLTVSGTTTTINTETINLADNQIVLNSNHTGAPTQDGGLIVNRGSSSNVLLLWDETQDRWEFTNDGSTYYNIPVSTTDLAEGTNLYYTNARVISGVTTANISNITVSGNVRGGNVFATQFYFANGTVFSSSGGGGGVSLFNEGNINSSTFYLLMANNTTTGTLTSANVSSTKLYFNPNTGTLNATVFNSLSDLNEKANLNKITNASSVLASVEGFEFEWKDTGKKSAGVIAQYIENVLPHLVDTNEKGTKSVNYSGLIGYLVETVKELDQRLRTLENK